MTKNKLIAGLGSIFLFIFCGLALAQEDRTGCKDHPLFTRMENFYIENCWEQKFDAVDFKNEKGKKITIEGHFYKLHYAIKEGFTPPSGLQVIRNYENAIKKIWWSKGISGRFI